MADARWTGTRWECALCEHPRDGRVPFLVYEYEPGEPVLALCYEHAVQMTTPRLAVPA